MIETQIPHKQRAWVATEPGYVELQSIDVPVPQFNEVLVKLEYTGVCHSGVGTVTAVGSGVFNLNIGDRVGIAWLNSACGKCEFCLQAHEGNCTSAKFTGFTLNGTFQEYAIAHHDYVARIPENVSLAAATSIFCAGVTVYKGIKEASPCAGQWIAIIGAAGGLGHLAIQYGKALGLQVLAIASGKEKRQFCLNLGADEFIDYKTSADIAADVKTVTKGGAHIVLVVASGDAYSQGISFLRPKGVLIALGLSPDAKIECDVFRLILQGYSIKGSVTGSRKDVEDALDFVSRGVVKPFYTVHPFSSLPKVLDDLQASKVTGRVVLHLSKE